MPDLAYSHDVHKLSDAGLQLNLPPDLVPPTQYSTFNNAVSRIEGRVETRDGTTFITSVGAAGSPVHSIFRLTQVIPTVIGQRLFGVGTQLWQAPLPAGNVPTQLTQYIVAGVAFPAFPIAFDGSPLSIASFRFDGDPQIWAIIANGNKMMKEKNGYYEQLGLPAPTVQAFATAGGSGLLNSTNGIPYDWRYTYVNSVTLSESDPSAEPVSSGPMMLSPSAFTNPDPTVPLAAGQFAFANPTFAYDLNPATYSLGDTANFANQVASCNWHGWTNPGTVWISLTLNVLSQCVISAFAAATGTALVQYSLDGGSTWSTLYQYQINGGGGTNSGTRPTQTDSLTLDNGQDLTQLQVRAICRAPTQSHVVMQINEIGVYAVPAAAPGDTLVLVDQSANICVTPPTDPQEDTIRLYRRGGSLTDNWYFVGSYPVASLTQGSCAVGMLLINDNSADSTIETNPTLQLDNDMPVTSVANSNQPITAIWVYNGRVLGCGDPNRPEAIYFSKNGNADEWPPENWIVVSSGGDQMMNGVVYDLRCYAFSRERLYILLPNVIQGVTFTPLETACRKGLKGRFAFALGEKGIYFVAKDGIYVTQGGLQQSIIEDSIRPLFPTRDGPGIYVNGYEPPNLDDEDGLRLAYHNGEIWFDYTGMTSGKRQTLIYDERRNRWRAWYGAAAIFTSAMQMHYSEPDTDSSLLFGTTSQQVWQGGGAGDPGSTSILVSLTTGAFDQSQPLNLKEYGNVIFDLDPGATTVTITPFINANALEEAAISVTGAGRQRVALQLADTIAMQEDLFGLNISFLVQWTTDGTTLPVLYQLDILWRIEPAAMKHWEVPPTALGMSGWLHVRDTYVTLRSAADVTMTFTPDNGPAQTFTLFNTNGLKQKIYVPLAANKFKLGQWSFDSTGDFRLYSSECEIRCKQWVTKLGYVVIPLFGAEQGGGG